MSRRDDGREPRAVHLHSEQVGKCHVCGRDNVTLARVEYAVSEPNEVMCCDCLVGPPLSLWGHCLVCDYFQPPRDGCVQCGGPIL